MINCHLQYVFDRLFCYFQHFNFRKSCSFYLTIWIENEKTAQLALNMWIPLCKIVILNNNHFIIFHKFDVVLKWLNNLNERCIMGCPSWMHLHRRLYKKHVQWQLVKVLIFLCQVRTLVVATGATSAVASANSTAATSTNAPSVRPSIFHFVRIL